MSSVQRLTEYGLVYDGHQLMTTYDSRETVEQLVALRVAEGDDPLAYEVVHRSVTISEWAPTVPALVTIAARRKMRAL